ncbi:response regulator [Paenibacillus alkaliterrae]|uniref:response regulator transcription factor n=1 Tax=Paenibacillus alkaliterrae TaxID=320909 RepID=UPI001F39D487|nr:response regulator [Paenibacillus alkaliterrae]MCF2939135.1 response regulator [Paenibacillus alkaliterrae]
MYKVLIVDDEPEIRQGLRLKADWDELGLRIAGEASNGMEAMEQLENEAFDIVITDMNMPVMDGMSFLNECRKLYPELRLIVITGYEDFGYAHAAVRHQARDYLLKPVARDELTEALFKVKSELDKEFESYKQAEDIKWRLSQYYKEMKEHFLVRAVKGEMEREDIFSERARLFQLEELNTQSVRFITAGLRERENSIERSPDKFRLPFELICRELAGDFPGSPQAFRDAAYPGLMHIVLQDADAKPEEFERKLQSIVKENIGFEPSIGIGQSVTGFNHWKDGYMSSLLAWNIEEANFRQGDRIGEEPSLLPEDTGKLIHRLLQRGEMEQLAQTIERELQEAFAVSRIRFVKTIFQFNLMLEELAYESNVSLEGGEQLWVRPETALDLSTVAKASRYLLSLAVKIHDKLQSGAEDTDYSSIQASQQYIDVNYMYDINLTMLAEKFNYNPSYFSELFKAKVGKTFIQYLTEVRMAHATHLLRSTALSLWDISGLTGFSNASYFSSKFKRMYGMTPSDYRLRQPEKNDSEFPKK